MAEENRDITCQVFVFFPFRLTPLYMMVVAIWATLFKYFGSGPYWPNTSDAACKTNWWLNLLYLHNVVRRDQEVSLIRLPKSSSGGRSIMILT